MKRGRLKVLTDSAEAAKFLAETFVRSGCVRVPDRRRRKEEGQAYKKGYEVRLSLKGTAELISVRDCLKRIGIEPGKPYAKGDRVVQAFYGKDAVVTFIEMVRSERVNTAKWAKLEKLRDA